MERKMTKVQITSAMQSSSTEMVRPDLARRPHMGKR